MILHVLISLFSICASSNITESGTDYNLSYFGKATDLKQGIHIYTEVHEERYSNGSRKSLLTTYHDTAGKVIVRRSVDFSRSTLLPDFHTEDLRSGYMEGAEQVASGVRLYWRKSAKDSIEQKIVRIPSPAVVDAGFNNFVQERWDSLMKGEELEMYFGLPFTLDYYRFRLYKDGEKEFNGRNAVVVRCEIDNFILRLFAKPIILMYDTETRRMISYDGISNINDERGNSYNVNIQYDPFGP